MARSTMEQGSHTLPPLSLNSQASQLLTPRQLDRITIDQPHYHGHLMESATTTGPPTAVQRRVGKMGDHHFHLQKELPVEQAYQRTALQLSQVRPWDQILERPLKSANMTNKEIDVPFPQEHPYTSHTSRFAVFPDTFHPNPPGHLVDAQTQTGSPPQLYQVTQKAVEKGQRVECRYLSAPRDVSVKPGAGTLLWDFPRSQRHKRAYTYPAPSLQYSRPSTAPTYLPLPSTLTPSTRPHSQASYEALSKIHQMLARTTTYSEQFSPPKKPQAHQNFFQTGYSFRSKESYRPWTAESRGKYNRVASAALANTSPRLDASADHTRLYRTHGNEDEPESELESESPSECGEIKEYDVPVMVDASTQTEEQYFEHPPTSSTLPSLATNAPERLHTTKTLPGTAAQAQYTQGHVATHSRLATPRSTQRLMSLFNGFNKTEILKQFHKEFPENAPDLREYSVHEGKRHIIHGSHAYYYH